LNYLRLDRTLDPDHWGWEQRSRVRRERLISLLTQVVARELSALTGANCRPSMTKAIYPSATPSNIS